MIRYLRRAALRQHAYEDAPQTHQKKTGTPTLGGLLFLLAPVVAFAVSRDLVVLAYGLLIAGSAMIGFIDDYLAIRGGRNRGLNARSEVSRDRRHRRGLPFLRGRCHARSPHRALHRAGAVLGMVRAFAGGDSRHDARGEPDRRARWPRFGTVVPPLALLAFVAARQGSPNVAIVAVAVIGAVLGFLLYNRHPAKIFMGDTGSLALGAALAGAAILTGSQLLLLLVGGVFVAETLSVIIQVTSYKTTKRRVFRMSPLHHHFELGGWPETRVTSTFWLASLLWELSASSSWCMHEYSEFRSLRS